MVPSRSDKKDHNVNQTTYFNHISYTYIYIYIYLKSMKYQQNVQIKPPSIYIHLL